MLSGYIIIPIIRLRYIFHYSYFDWWSCFHPLLYHNTFKKYGVVYLIRKRANHLMHSFGWKTPDKSSVRHINKSNIERSVTSIKNAILHTKLKKNKVLLTLIFITVSCVFIKALFSSLYFQRFYFSVSNYYLEKNKCNQQVPALVNYTVVLKIYLKPPVNVNKII